MLVKGATGVQSTSSQHWSSWWLGAYLVTCSHYLNHRWLRSITPYGITILQWDNTLRLRQNGRHFADDTFNRIYVNENFRISTKFSLKFVPKGPINNIPALIQIMAWRRPGDKPLSEPVMVSLLTHICITRPQWVKVEITSFLKWWNDVTPSIHPYPSTFRVSACPSVHLSVLNEVTALTL